MKKLLLGTTTVAAALFATPAMAQDNQAVSPFAGPYVGAQVGMGKVENLHSDVEYFWNGEKDGSTIDRGALFGARAGYDFVSGSLIAGVLGEVSFGKLNSVKETSNTPEDGPNHEIGTRLTRLGSVRGRIGLTAGPLAATVNAGLARSNATQRFLGTYSCCNTGENFFEKGDRSGYVVGLGLEYALGRSVFGLDYSEYRFGSKSHEVIEVSGVGTGDSYDLRYNIKSLGLTYRYRFGANAGSVAATTPDVAFSGPYVGVQAGMAQLEALHHDVDYWYDAVDRGRTSERGALLGLKLGYDHIVGNFLVGALAEVSFGKLNSFQSAGAAIDDPSYAIGVRTSRVGSIRAKGGVAAGKLTAFGTVGLARSNGTVKYREQDGSDDRFDSKADRSGYVVGLGAAYAVGNSASLGLDFSEYRFGNIRNAIVSSEGESTDFFFDQKYKVRALALTLNYGF